MKSACTVLFAVATALLASILIRSMGAAFREPASDDLYYLRYMQAVGTEGLGVFPRLFESWLATPKDWIFPPPSRVGFIVVTALWSKAFGATYQGLQALSVASHLLLVVLNYAFARRRFGEPRALFVGVLFGFSPLLMGVSRLALTDAFTALCMTTTVWLFLDLVEDASVRRAVLFTAALAFMVLVKELSVLLVVPFAAFLAYERYARGIEHDLRRFAACFVAAGVVSAGIAAVAAGGPKTLVSTARIVMASPDTNTYAIQYGSGPWTRAILDYLLLSPWPTLLAIGWFAVQALRLREGRYERESVYLGFVAGSLVLLLAFFTKNVRYTVVLELPIRVFAVLFLSELLGGLRSARSVALAGAAVLLLCWLDWRTFEGLWVGMKCYDPITFVLAVFRELLPAPPR